MTSSTTNCPQCGTAFPARYAAPLCPACLLKLGFESRDSSAGPATSPYQPRFLIPTPEELAPRFPQLEILERIGVGGMGVVYRARQKELDRIVALKILRPDFGPEANFAERFQREARALARLSHPHIVTVHDFGRIDDVYYFVMEYIDGVNLRQLERAGQLAPAQALALVPQVCEALQYAHEQGVVHRDIKPENILITRDGRVKIADFGLAKLAGHAEQSHLTGTWQVMGTPHYMAPEQVERPTEVDHRADIYSLGVVFYEMLTGELPLGRFPLPSSKAQLDIRLDDVVLRSLEKSPERRYQHATDVQTDVEQIQQTPGKTAGRKAATTEDRYAGEPDVVRERVLADLALPANGLFVLGLVEAASSVLVLFIGHWIGLLLSLATLAIGGVTVWTGLTLKSGENLRSSLIGGGLTLIPISFLWPFKVAFLALAGLTLRHPAARSAFGSVAWRNGEAWQTILDCLQQARLGITVWWQAAWNHLPTPPSPQATVDAVKLQAAQIPERVAPAVQTAAAVIRHPLLRGVVGWAFWSVVWSAWCLIALALAVELTELQSGRYRAEHERLFTTVGLFIAFSWFLGEIVLTWNGFTCCLLRLRQQTISSTSGPRRALLTAAGSILSLAVLLMIADALGTSERWSTWYDLQNRAGFGEISLVQLLFALCTGLAAVLLPWNPLRWVSRMLLLLAIALPAATLLVLSIDRPSVPPVALTLWPTVLSLPALLWGFWGTRRVRAAEPVSLRSSGTTETEGQLAAE